MSEFTNAQRALAKDWGFACYEDALRSWIATVAIVEVGYVGEWEDYVHELEARDYLDEVARRAPSLHPTIERDLAPWDERFRTATVEHGEPHMPPDPGRDAWWQYRSPVNWRRPATEEIKELRARELGD
jgi:hypothetical protein